MYLRHYLHLHPDISMNVSAHVLFYQSVNAHMNALPSLSLSLPLLISPGTEVILPSELVITPRPTILKPQPLWTGKQIITALLAHICSYPLPSLHLDSKTRTPPTAFGAEENEHIVIIRYGELLTGLLLYVSTSRSISHEP